MVHWVFAASVEAGILVLALQRKLTQRLPLFVLYLAALVAFELFFFSIYGTVGFAWAPYFYTFWSAQALFILLRALVVYEVCRSILSPLAGVWRLVRPILFMVGSVLLLAMLISMSGSPLSIKTAIPLGQRGLEVAIAGLLISGLAFCRYYHVEVENYLAWIALGLGFHSVVQATDSTLLPWLSSFSAWAMLSHASFDIALLMWLVALRKPLPAQQPARALWAHGEYEALSPQVTAQLRALNTRLLEIWK